MLQPGAVLDGKYRIERVIGTGGTSTVYLAVHERLGSLRAVKEVPKDAALSGRWDPSGLSSEVLILKDLHHPCLPEIVDIFETDETFLIVMDYVEGRTLAEVIREEGAQSEERVIDWAKQICEVLICLHEQDPPVIYRDLKPSNLMLRPDGQLVLIDFGTASEGSALCGTKEAYLGTRGYAAPEQYSGAQSDERTDIYALGATMQHLLTGVRPVEPYEKNAEHRHCFSGISKDLERVTDKCMCRNPDGRYADCRALLDDLQDLKRRRGSLRSRSQNRRHLYVCSCLLTVLCAVGCLFFRAAQIRAIADGYETLLQEAARTSTITERTDIYERAVLLSPSREEAYLKLLDLYIYGIDGNGGDGTDTASEIDFSRTESAQLIALLGYAGDADRTNESYLSENEAGYASVCFTTGLYYFYYFDGGGNAGKALSAGWLENALQTGALDVEKQTMAESLEKIAAYYALLGQESVTGYETSVSYAQYWADLDALTGDRLAEILPARSVITICSELIVRVRDDVVAFKRSGISEACMNEKLSALREMIETLSEDLSEADAAAAEEALLQIREAEEQVEIAFSGQDSADLEGGT